MKSKPTEGEPLTDAAPTPRVPSGSSATAKAGASSVRMRLGIARSIRLPPASTDGSANTLPALDPNEPSVEFAQTLKGDLPCPSDPPRSFGSGDSWTAKLSVGEEIGRGGMAVVHKAVDEDLHRELAVKVSALGASGSQGDLVRFVEEAQITAQLEHPNVVPVHELGVDPDGRPFFTMKLVRGNSLESILEKRRAGDPDTVAHWGLTRLLGVFLSVCQAIEYAHARGVIHRDLKPANIMVGDFGEVLVMDWGVAKVRGRTSHRSPRATIPSDVETVRSGQDAHQTVSGTVLGTPSYMAPEQARGDADVDERADLYALGAILYELLCGRPPFEGTTALSVLTRVMVEAPTPPSRVDRSAKVPPVLEELALRLLEKNPARRWVTLPQIRSQVQDYIEGIAIEYRPETLSRQASWGIGALVVFAFVVWYLTGQSAAQLLSPRVALTSAGWFMLILVMAFPLWSVVRTSRVMRAPRDRFRTPTEEEVFSSGFLAHRRFTAAVAPLFQLALFAETAVLVVPNLSASPSSAELLDQISAPIHREASNVLIIPFVLLFAYIYLQSTEVRFARSIDRFEPLIRRSAWELIWPFALILTIEGLVFGLDALHWGLAHGHGNPIGYLDARVIAPHVDVFPVLKTIVFQGTFLGGLLVLTLLLIYPFPEVLAALRLRYHAVDEAYVRARRQYFLRSLSVFHVARANALYGGAMIGCLTAMTVLGQRDEEPVMAKAIYILGPSLLGVAAFALISSYLRGCLSQAPAVRTMLEARIRASRIEEIRARYRTAVKTTWASRLVQLLAPAAAIATYVLWVRGPDARGVLADLFQPSTFKDVLAALPFVLLVPAVLVGDKLQKRFLRWRHGAVVEGDVYVTAQLDRASLDRFMQENRDRP